MAQGSQRCLHHGCCLGSRPALPSKRAADSSRALLPPADHRTLGFAFGPCWPLSNYSKWNLHGFKSGPVHAPANWFAVRGPGCARAGARRSEPAARGTVLREASPLEACSLGACASEVRYGATHEESALQSGNPKHQCSSIHAVSCHPPNYTGRPQAGRSHTCKRCANRQPPIIVFAVQNSRWPAAAAHVHMPVAELCLLSNPAHVCAASSPGRLTQRAQTCAEGTSVQREDQRAQRGDNCGQGGLHNSHNTLARE